MKSNQTRLVIFAVVVLAIFAFPIWDVLFPMAGSSETIAAQYGTQFSWCVALTYSWRSDETHRQRIYVLIPQSFSTGSLVAVQSTNDERPTTNEIPYGVFLLIPVYGGCLFALSRLKSPSQVGPKSSGQDSTPHV
jgi:hypothetical protein